MAYHADVMKQVISCLYFSVVLLACGLGDLSFTASSPTSTPTFVVAEFRTPAPTVGSAADSIDALGNTDTPAARPTATPSPSPTPEVIPTETSGAIPTPTPLPEGSPTSGPSPTAAIVSPTDTPASEPLPAPEVDFVLRYVRLRTNEENSWDGTLGPGNCGSDHSIYVHVADAQENLLDGVLIGDKFGNFEVPTGVDGPGAVRILVWSATMELAVVGHQDGTRYTSQFTPPLSTLDEDIPLDWLQQAGFCESPDDCQWRVDNNQLCRGHYSYDVIFQRTW